MKEYIITDEQLRIIAHSARAYEVISAIKAVKSRSASSTDEDTQYQMKGYVIFSKAERDKIMAFLSQPFGKETIKEMREIVRRHEQEAYERGVKDERGRVLDELKARVQEEEKYCNDKGDSDENYTTANGWYARCFQCAEIVGIIESFRREEMR